MKKKITIEWHDVDGEEEISWALSKDILDRKYVPEILSILTAVGGRIINEHKEFNNVPQKVIKGA